MTSWDLQPRPPGDVGKVIDDWLEMWEVPSVGKRPPWISSQVGLVEYGPLVEGGEEVVGHSLAIEDLGL